MVSDLFARREFPITPTVTKSLSRSIDHKFRSEDSKQKLNSSMTEKHSFRWHVESCECDAQITAHSFVDLRPAFTGDVFRLRAAETGKGAVKHAHLSGWWTTG